MIRHLENQLLARFDEKIMSALTPHLAIVNLEQGRVLSETHAVVDKVYFPHNGIISCVVELVGGGAIETGMIGKDGQFGAGPAMDHKVSLNYVECDEAVNSHYERVFSGVAASLPSPGSDI